MLLEKLPSTDDLINHGKFLGYFMPGYYECFLYQRLTYIIIDGVSNDKYWYRVERFKGKTTNFPKGFDLTTGNPIYKFLPRHKLEELRNANIAKTSPS